MSYLKKLYALIVFMALVSPTFVFSAACSDKGAQGGAKIAGVENCDQSDLTNRITSIINSLFFIIGALAVLVLLYGAIRYITSTGDSKRVQAAKDTIIYAIAGLVVAILAPAIVGFVIGSLF